MKPEIILIIICEVLELDFNKLIGKNCKHSRNPKYCDGRHLGTYLIKQYSPKLTNKEIALILGKRLQNGTGDHSAVLYYNKISKTLLEIKDKKFTEKYNKIVSKIMLK